MCQLGEKSSNRAVLSGHVCSGENTFIVLTIAVTVRICGKATQTDHSGDMVKGRHMILISGSFIKLPSEYLSCK